MIRIACAILLLLLVTSIPRPGDAAQAQSPVQLILDTDIGNDIDDVLALAMIHALQNRGEVHLLAVTITKDSPHAAPLVDLINTFYGRPEIPIGMVRNGKTPDDTAMLRVPAEHRQPNGRYLFPHRLTNGSQAQDAVPLLAELLRKQPDASVTIAQIGFSTNLARLLQAQGGRDLVKQKVKLLALMGGNFAQAKPEYNIATDREAAAALLRDWPTPMVFSGFEIGLAVKFPYAAYSSGFRYTANHPVVDSADGYFPKPEDRAAWDPTAVLYAVRPEGQDFDLSESGTVTLDERSATRFHPEARGLCRYLKLRPERAAVVQQELVDLVTEPPAIPSRR